MSSVTRPMLQLLITKENICRLFGRLLHAAGFQPVTYDSAESFLADTRYPWFGLLAEMNIPSPDQEDLREATVLALVVFTSCRNLNLIQSLERRKSCQ